MPAAVQIPSRDHTTAQPPQAGSPMSYKTMLGVSRSFRAAVSPMQGFGHSDVDFKLSSSMTVGSVESESSRLMRALSGSQSRASGNTLGEYLHSTTREKEFCSDFTCCGTTLNDLHALVEHFEDCHVRVVPSEFPFPVPGPTAPTTSSVVSILGAAPAGMDPEEMEMEHDAPSPSSSNSPPHTPLAQPGASAFDTTSVFLPYRRTSDLGPTAAYFNGTPMVQRSHSIGTHPNGPGIQPALLTRTPDDTPQSSPPATPSSNTKTLNGTRRIITGPIVPNAASDPRPPLPGGKPFRCPTPNCTKSYKQANGLKYHLTHGQCSFLPPDPVLENLTDKEADERLRPFVCAVGSGAGGKGGGCGRRYKNMNGLRYHYQHSGAHGAVGLAMLAANTHPAPPAWALGVTTSSRSSPHGSGDSPTSTPITSRPGSSMGHKSTPGSSHAATEDDFDGDDDMEMEFDMS
ncbi:hypothetical protein CPB86DRAFT_714023 [Serendipita vermifera]|nr:hypothetical protein CPB86DRAFT_714023 [Serendipita vermifera]